MKKLLLALSLIVLAIFAVPQPTHASSRLIDGFSARVFIGDSGMADVTETITYNMGDMRLHGLKRIIPVAQTITDQGRTRYVNSRFELIGASEDGNDRVHFTQNSIDGGRNIRILVGDPNTTKTGTHNYTLHYRIGPVTFTDGNVDIVNYNVTGFDWDIALRNVNANITIPDGLAVKVYQCFTGAPGSKQSDCTNQLEGNTVFVKANSDVLPGHTLSLEVDLPTNTFSSYATITDTPPAGLSTGLTPLALYTVIGVGIYFMLMMGLVVFAITRSFVRHHLFKKETKRRTVIAQYEPPDQLKPAEISMLNFSDDYASSSAITATLIDLAVRGYLKIGEEKTKTVLRSASYRFTICKLLDGLEDYELETVKLVFGDASIDKDSSVVFVPSADTARQKLAISITDSVKNRLSQAGYFAVKTNKIGRFANKKHSLVNGLKNGYTIIIILFALAALALVFLPALAGFITFTVVAGLMIFIPIFIVFSMTQIRYTAKGYDEWAKVEGFKLFLSVTEQERIKFENAPKATPALFNKFLPYAIALGVEEKWSAQFANITMSPDQVNWYAGSSAAFDATAFSSSFVTSFTSSIGSTTSISSGGGGAGGVGGGGGGGW